jgi:TPR repeat protein
MHRIHFAILLLWGCALTGAETTVDQLKKKAEAGDPAAQYRLAQMLENRGQSAPNVPAAIQWYERAASQGNSKAMLRLGILYYNGDVHGDAVQTDPQTAWLWFTFAAASGEQTASAQADNISSEFLPIVLRDLRLRAANSLMFGKMVPSNVAGALGLYRVAALDGSVEAAEVLGDLYREGKRVPRDLEEAARWWEKATALGSPKGMYALARIAESGSPPDFGRALQLYRKAAQKADAQSIFRIGEMYSEGIAMARDPMLADAWFKVASYLGLREAQAAAAKLEAKLTHEQAGQAQIEASRILDSIGLQEHRIEK